MGTRVSLICDWLGTDFGAALVVGCLAIAALVLTLIVLGFGPLRAWLQPTVRHKPWSAQVNQGDSGLRATWRLYRRLRSAEMPPRLFCAESTTGDRISMYGKEWPRKRVSDPS